MRRRRGQRAIPFAPVQISQLDLHTPSDPEPQVSCTVPPPVANYMTSANSQQAQQMFSRDDELSDKEGEIDAYMRPLSSPSCSLRSDNFVMRPPASVDLFISRWLCAVAMGLNTREIDRETGRSVATSPAGADSTPPCEF